MGICAQPDLTQLLRDRQKLRPERDREIGWRSKKGRQGKGCGEESGGKMREEKERKEEGRGEEKKGRGKTIEI